MIHMVNIIQKVILISVVCFCTVDEWHEDIVYRSQVGQFVSTIQVQFVVLFFQFSYLYIETDIVHVSTLFIVKLHPHRSSKPAGNDVIGIDLGTTNSCVAVMEGKVRFSLLICFDMFSVVMPVRANSYDIFRILKSLRILKELEQHHQWLPLTRKGSFLLVHLPSVRL